MAADVVDAKHVLREIRLIRYLGVHPNVITLEDLWVKEQHDELYIVMELLDSDLHRIIQSSQPLSDAHFRFFMYQLLRGVKFMHDNGVIHRDLKPGNLLVTRNCELRITDFGLARMKPEPYEDETPMTEHVVTRWYRPPELMLCPDGLYSYDVDMWSSGCIFAEMLGRKPFFPGKNFVHQLTLIFDAIGSPHPAEVAHIRNSQARKFLDSIASKQKVAFETIFPSATDLAIDLLESLLIFDPPKRLDVHQALDHQYFSPLRQSEPVIHDPPISQDFEFDFEEADMSRLELKNIILEEVESFQREVEQRVPAAETGLKPGQPTISPRDEDAYESQSKGRSGGQAAAAAPGEKSTVNRGASRADWNAEEVSHGMENMSMSSKR
eukprot:CAMPEP_0113944210 /NCGR_PEP_ID=MMETSP1339-20121228/31372_1 /TAXON_ID=94617 /ORGANISM="Fibrocapsa japonica" /LENGTH=380 /DNA_ID=CAMNT_0000949317 /DNA_START=208 /DNA_END=1350 /DNA_ORIENTATION=- /assembly_acc=CAM_ASM_000762